MSGQLELAPGKLAHPSGALWLADQAALLVAEARLGYGWAQRRRGEPGPLYDGGAHKRLKSVVDELKPETLVFLGEVEAPHAAPQEQAALDEILNALARRADVVIVRGIPDRAFARRFGDLRLRLADQWRRGDVVAIHGGRPKDSVPRGHTLVAGHFHPAAAVSDASGTARLLPAFARSRRAILLPAFSPFAGGLDMSRAIPTELREMLGRGPVQVAVTTGRRVMSLKLLGGD